MGNLSNMVLQVAQLEMALIESGGEITKEIEAMLIVKDVDVPAKVDAYAFTIERLEKSVELLSAKADQYKRMAKSAENAISRLKGNMLTAIEIYGKDYIEGIDSKFTVRQSPPACIINDESVIPGEYLITETITKIDKKKIISDIKAGKHVSGADIAQGTWLKVGQK